MNPPQVTVELHREKDLLSARTSYGKSGVGKVAISSCLWRFSSRHSVFWRHVTYVQVANCERRTMEQVRGTNYWMYTFTNAQLLNVKSADKSNSDRIVAENFLAMVFYTTLKIRNQDFKLHVSPLTACSVLSHFSEFNCGVYFSCTIKKPSKEHVVGFRLICAMTVFVILTFCFRIYLANIIPRNTLNSSWPNLVRNRRGYFPNTIT